MALTATLDLEGVGRAWARFARAALAATAATPAFRGPAALTAPRMPLATWVGEDPG